MLLLLLLYFFYFFFFSVFFAYNDDGKLLFFIFVVVCSSRRCGCCDYSIKIFRFNVLLHGWVSRELDRKTHCRRAGAETSKFYFHPTPNFHVNTNTTIVLTHTSLELGGSETWFQPSPKVQRLFKSRLFRNLPLLSFTDINR